jgi:hypothetical protein
MKIFVRIITLVILTNFILSFFLFPDPTPFKEIDTPQERAHFAWMIASMISIFIWDACVIWHCAMSEFINRRQKRMWLLVTLFGTLLYFLGPVIYYFAVVENGKGLRTKEPRRR